MDGADHGAAGVHGVAHGAHHDGGGTRIQPCEERVPMRRRQYIILLGTAAIHCRLQSAYFALPLTYRSPTHRHNSSSVKSYEI